VALRQYDEDRDGCGPVTVGVLERARLCCFRLGRTAEYLDFSLKLLSRRLWGSVEPARRRVLAREVLYMLTGVDVAPQEEPPPIIAAEGFGADAAAPAPPPQGAARGDEDSGLGPYEPMVSSEGEVVEVALRCEWRQLVSAAAVFKSNTCAKAKVCPVLLRLVSHLPFPLPLSRIELASNRDYIGTITLHNSLAGSVVEKLRQMAADPASCPAPPPPQYVEADDKGAASVPLLLRPEQPLDIPLGLPIPTHELVKVEDIIHVTTFKLFLDVDARSPPPPRALGKPVCMTIPSGVKHVEGLGVVLASSFEVEEGAAPATEVSTLPVALRAAVRLRPMTPHVVLCNRRLARVWTDVWLRWQPPGFAFVEVTRLTAHASVSLARAGGDAPSDRARGDGPPVLTALVDQVKCVVLQLDARQDALTAPELHVRCDPPPRSNRPEDAFFFRLPDPSVGAGGISILPRPVAAAPHARLSIPPRRRRPRSSCPWCSRRRTCSPRTQSPSSWTGPFCLRTARPPWRSTSAVLARSARGSMSCWCTSP
jgi:hypothetical protein